MLRDFITDHRPDLIERCRRKVARRRAPRASPDEIEHGIPRFVDQLTEMLPGSGRTRGESPLARESRISTAESQIQDIATRHGNELLRHDFSIDQVVHDYGDLCQAITELASERSAPITVEEFGSLNITLDNAIATAVTEYSRQRDVLKANEGERATSERLGTLAHELRNLLNTTILAVSAIKGGTVGFGGATAAALDRSLIAMRGLIDKTLAEVRLADGSPPSRDVIELGPLIAEIQVAAALEASSRGCELTVLPVEPGIRIEGDRHILASAAANLLQNAFKFSRSGGHVVLSVHAWGERVFIDIQDECGGLPQGRIEDLFRPFEKRGVDRTGAGMGLAISRQGIAVNGGKLYARSMPGKGCVFTIDLPRKQQ